MDIIECRLCSSASSLISLFNGKSRKNRDYIRKLIDITTGIKFQQNDTCKCVCYPCTVQIYNFYIFRRRSIENERRLQEVYTEEKSSSNKVGILELADMDLPKIQELADTLGTWLISKQKFCKRTRDENVNENKEVNNDRYDNVSNNVNDTLKREHQNSVEYSDKEIQCEISSREVYTQTKNLATKAKKTQCDLVIENQNTSKNECFDKEIQCGVLSDEASTQTNNLSTRVKRTQCELLKDDKKMPRIETNDFTTQAENTQCNSIELNKIVECVNKETQYDLSIGEASTQTNNLSTRVKKTQCELLKDNHMTPRIESSDSVSQNEKIHCEIVEIMKTVEYFNKETQYDLSGGVASTQTEDLSTKVKKTQCELLRDDLKILRPEISDSTTQTVGVDQLVHYDSENDQHIDCKDDFRASFIDVKHESPSVKSMSPPVLSPMMGLNITVDSSSKTERSASPAFNCPSPASSNLLTIKNKSRYVIICPNCDQSLYSKIQYKAHTKSHMVCNFCKQKFKSIKRTKLHIENECKVRKLTNTVPVVTLVRLESLRDVQKKYPTCMEELKEGDCKTVNGDVHRSFRMRSRSTSSTESFYSSCNACKSCFSLMQQLSLGVDKCIQTNLLFDTDFIKSQVVIKRKFKDDLDDEIPAKKSKISA